jgi:hypothetical protein
VNRFKVRCNTALKKGSARWIVYDTTNGHTVHPGHRTRREAVEEAVEYEKEVTLESPSP